MNDETKDLNSFDIDAPEPVEESGNQEKPQTSGTAQTSETNMDPMSAVELPDLEYAEKREGPQNVVEKDAKPLAVKFAVIGAGQGGSRLADTFWQIGYRRVCALNTTEQDFLGLQIPKDNQLTIGEGGAGKDLEKGEKAIRGKTEEVMNLMRQSFGDDIERIIVTVGAGGGSGSGCAETVIRLAKHYFSQIGKEPKVGLMMSLPKYSEGGMVQANAYKLLQKLKPMIDQKEISPVVITDNQSIYQMFPNVSAKHFWSKANRNTVGLFDIFNVLADQRSEYTTFDRADYKSMLDSGVIVFGATKLNKYKSDTDIADALRTNLQRSLLAEGLDLQESTHVAGIIAAPDELLEVLPQSHIDLAFETLERVLGGQNRNLLVHQGVYEAKNSGLFLYTMVGGLQIPEKRINTLKAKSGLELLS